MRTGGETVTATFGLNRPPGESDYGIVSDADGEWIVRGTQRLMPAAALLLTGRHNLANALAAVALVELAGYPLDAAGVEALSTFPGLRHRCEQVLDRNGIIWINDSKSTNPGATVAALKKVRLRPKVITSLSKLEHTIKQTTYLQRKALVMN